MKAPPLLLLLCLLLFGKSASAQSFVQSGDKRFEYFQLQDYLPGKMAKAFLQDRLGYIWIGSEQGLTRYDGLKFNEVEIIGAEADILRSSTIETLYEDQKGFIWIGTRHQGAFRYNPANLQVTQVLFEPEVYNTYNRNHVMSFGEDRSNFLCVGTADGFYRFAEPHAETLANFIEYQPPVLPDTIRLWCRDQYLSENTLAAIIDQPIHMGKSVGFTLTKPTQVAIVGANIKQPNRENGLWLDTYLLTEQGKKVWQMKLEETIEINHLIDGANRFSWEVRTLPPGDYILQTESIGDGVFRAMEIFGAAIFPIEDGTAQYLNAHWEEAWQKAGLNEQVVESIFTDEQGVTWLGGGGGVTKMEILDPNDPMQVKLTSLGPIPGQEIWSRAVHTRDIQKGIDGKVFFAGTTFGENEIWGASIIDQYNPETGSWTHWSTDLLPPEQVVSSICQNDDGSVWVTTREFQANAPVGLYVVHPDQSVVYYPLHTPEDPHTPLNVNFVRRDNQNGVWIGTDNGLFYYTTSLGIFQLREITKQQAAVPIHSIVEDGLGNVWMATRGNGIYRYHPETQAIEQFNSQNSGLVDDVVETMAIINEEGNLWLGTSNGYIQEYQMETNAFRSIQMPNNNKYFSSESSFQPYYIFPGGADRLMVSTVDGSLLQIDTEKGGVEKFHQYYNDSIEVYEYGVPIATLWINDREMLFATSGGALLKLYFPQRGNYDKIKFEVLPHWLEIYSMTQDESGVVWLATTKGLYRLSKDLETLKKISLTDNVMDQAFTDLAIDSQSNIWLQSRTGLYKFDQKKKDFTRFDERSGLSAFNNKDNTIHRFSNGRMMASSGLGYVIFDPVDIRLPEHQPSVILERIKVADAFLNVDQKGPLKQSIATAKKVQLNHRQNDITLYFAALVFNQSKDYPFLYRYKLEGYDEQFIRAWDNRSAVYTNLSPGTYSFQVQASKDGKNWTSTAHDLNMIISPPWYQTWWAYLLFAGVLLGAAYAIYRMLLNNRLKREEANRLREMDALKTKLYTNITHEFRTPLTIIIGMARQIQERPASWVKDGTEMIIRNGYQLLNQVNQMLDLSKLESGKLLLKEEDMDVIAFAKYISESFHSFAETKGIQLHFLSDLSALHTPMDKIRLQQILSNLLSNAIKFTPERGHVYLQMQRKSSNQLKIEVRDTGRGISSEHLEHLFERFYQADNLLTRKGEGTGIGLALTYELVKLMGGSIDVRSAVGQGSTFTIVLPVREATLHSTAGQLEKAEQLPFPVSTLSKSHLPEEVPQNGNGASDTVGEQQAPLILIAEDNADVVRYLRSCLESFYRIMVAPDGQAGEEMAQEHIPDLIISDVMMPRKDGFSFCKSIKADIRTSHIPVIMLTAKADTDSKLTGLEGGADAYLAKPFDPRELRIRIRKLLELRQNLQKHYLGVADSLPGKEPETEESSPLPQEDAFVSQLRTFVLDRLDDTELSVEDLCREVMLSHSQLHRKLTALTGLSANHFVRHIRLQEAKALLKNPSLSITAVAFDTGFNDPSYFGRVFKKEFGKTPTAFREDAQVPNS